MEGANPSVCMNTHCCVRRARGSCQRLRPVTEWRGGARMEQPGQSSAGSSPQLSKWIRLGVALLLLAGALVAAFTQPLRPAALRAPTRWEWFRYPRETNAFLRAPVVTGEIHDAVQ